MSIVEEAADLIEQKYQELGYQIGWRFLNCSATVLTARPSIALVTANPGGDRIETDHPSLSCEFGHSYTSERWGNSEPGASPLQVQLQKLFELLANISGLASDGTTLLEQSLAGYYIPFRSPRLSDLPNAAEARSVGRTIWGNVLNATKPGLLISIDRDTFKELGTLITEVYGLHLTDTTTFSTGWGKYTADVADYGDGKVRLVRLPHLSTFKLFSRSDCRPHLDEILSYACDPIRVARRRGGLWDDD